MNIQLVAIRDGEYNKAIEHAEDRLKVDPNDVSSHFTLAQSYEATGEPGKAFEHIKFCLVVLPSSFESLALATRCASKLELYDEAYKYAQLALKDDKDANLPKVIDWIFRGFSLIPGLKYLRSTNNSVVRIYEKQTQWLHEYSTWYENVHLANKVNRRTKVRGCFGR